jgi:transposase
MRKQYDGLYALVVAELKADPLSGDLFLFTNRRRTRAKVLLWGAPGQAWSWRKGDAMDP